MNLLALDQASVTGWALWDGSCHHHGVLRLTKYSDLGDRFWALMQFMLKVHRDHPLDYVGYEIQYVGENPNVQEPAWGLVATVRLFCRSRGLPAPIGFTPAQWRSKVYGPKKVRAPKHVKNEEERKAWHVQNAYRLCEELELEVSKPDEAEAVAILEALKAEVSSDDASRNRERVTGQRELAV